MNLAPPELITGLLPLIFAWSIFVIAAILFFRLSETKKPSKLGGLFAIIHFVLLVLWCVSLYFALKKEPQADIAWCLYLFVFDMPISLIIILTLGDLLGKIIGDSSIYLYFSTLLTFGLLGSLQYFLIGVSVGWLYKKKGKKEKGTTALF